MSPRAQAIIGWTATGTTIAMYLSYVDQIGRNLAGEKGSLVLPLATFFNCILWCSYAVLRQPRREWPIFVANAPGIPLAIAAFVTAL